MAEMQRGIKAHSRPGRYPWARFPVAVAAGFDRTGLFAGCDNFLMASDAFGVIEIHKFFSGPILDPFEL